MASGALLLLAVSAVIPKRSRPGFYPLLTVAIGGLALAASIWQWNDIGDHGAQITIGTQVYYDRFSAFFMVLFSVATILGAVTADSYLRREGLDGVEAYVLMLMAGTGAMLMAVSAGLIMLFLGLEIMSISLYVMAAYHRRRFAVGRSRTQVLHAGGLLVGHLPVRSGPRLRRHRVHPVPGHGQLPGPQTV